MRSIREVAGRELLWVQPKNGLTFELRAGDEVVGTLAWQRTSLAIGETGDGRWSFKRDGFWHPRVTVRVPGSDDNVALFHPSWTGGGSLELGVGKQFRFGSANFWRSQWDWMDESGQPLAHIKNHGKGFKLECEVVIENQASAPPNTVLLVVLGWYLLVLSSLDAQSGGGA